MKEKEGIEIKEELDMEELTEEYEEFEEELMSEKQKKKRTKFGWGKKSAASENDDDDNPFEKLLVENKLKNIFDDKAPSRKKLFVPVYFVIMMLYLENI